MKLETMDMTEEIAKQILQWKYDAPYDLYNNQLTNEGIRELLECGYMAIADDNKRLVGFYCTGNAAQVPAGHLIEAYREEMIDIGLGMKPDLTGRGLGSMLLSYILKRVEESFGTTLPIRLTVATFNTRAIRLYENFGFRQDSHFQANGIDFQTMIKFI
jgi:[ribosomal protein S18]-alanine N-acetyltransferase